MAVPKVQFRAVLLGCFFSPFLYILNANKAIAKNGKANIIVATGASQFEMLGELVKKDIEWNLVTGFHLDEYIGIDETHPASFRKYLKERFVSLVPLKKFHYVNATDAENGEFQNPNLIWGTEELDRF